MIAAALGDPPLSGRIRPANALGARARAAMRPAERASANERERLKARRFYSGTGRHRPLVPTCRLADAHLERVRSPESVRLCSVNCRGTTGYRPLYGPPARALQGLRQQRE